MLIQLFRSAGATGHVFLLKNGRVQDKGLAYSGLIGPKTTVAIVPTTPQILNFAIEAQTEDKQGVVVRGSARAAFTPANAVSHFDFTVDRGSGEYLGEWEQLLNAAVLEHIMRAVLDEVKTIKVADATHSQKEVEDAVARALGDGSLAKMGITVDSCSIPKIDPREDEIRKAIGAGERQAMLTEADTALHKRRMAAGTNERAVQTYEAETALKLEEERGKLLEEEAKNQQKRAVTDATATTTRLAPLREVEAGLLVGAALMKFAEAGHIENFSFVPELFAAANGHAKS